MKEQILNLRAEGKSYNDIISIVGCSKGLVAYYCNNTTKDKQRVTTKQSKQRSTASTRISKKLEGFKGRSGRRSFCPEGTITTKEVYERYGDQCICYLTGESINLIYDDYQFDHIIPISNGGSCNIDNLGITIPSVNYAKGNLSVDEFVELCKKVVLHQGYTII